ncbi:hypothetical protein B7494_g4752 [Chlorociboria aeruginascens]|nr:hypothetical protein B7494_g4752 [Chlorociboria aeruginascens]
MPFNIVIVGTGIAGLGAAITLVNKGHNITVLEATSQLRPIGGVIVLQANANRVLDMGHAHKKQYGYPLCPLHRADLQQVLYEAAIQRGITLRLGCPVVTLDEDDQTLAVVVKGGERIEADVIVGADGIESTVRRSIVPDSAYVHDSGEARLQQRNRMREIIENKTLGSVERRFYRKSGRVVLIGDAAHAALPWVGQKQMNEMPPVECPKTIISAWVATLILFRKSQTTSPHTRLVSVAALLTTHPEILKMRISKRPRRHASQTHQSHARDLKNVLFLIRGKVIDRRILRTLLRGHWNLEA